MSVAWANLAGAAVVTVEFKTTTGVEGSFADNIQISPNPFTNTLNITGAANSVLQVMDVAGAKVYTQKISWSDEVVHLNKLPEGVYFFHIEKDKQVKIVKIVKK